MASAQPADATWSKWHRQLELAKNAKGFDSWEKRAKRIIKRYRDERTDTQTDVNSDVTTGTRFNILWSNVQTLMPALFAKTPKPVVERRYLDRDDIGRTASVILQRALMYELDQGSYVPSLRKAVLDRLLPGRGVVWIRYDAQFQNVPPETQQPKGTPDPATIEDKDELDRSEKPEDKPQEEVAYECVPVDYIDWSDFLTSPSRTWEEVWWVSKRVYMTRKELVARFGKKLGEAIPLDFSASAELKSSAATEGASENDRAKVWEIWNKRDRKVHWLAEGWSEEMLDEKPDPLRLECFFPVPKPIYATLTNDSLIPVPDYYEYQDQANELDDLTSRITDLTKAIKVAGVYDASVPALKRMFQEGFENSLVPVDNMAEFSQKAGPDGMGAIWLLPIKDMASVLIGLHDARERVKQALYEITGISDIVRGQAGSGPAATATEQRIKGQFASMRLNDMQAEVARFARDTLRIMGEIISEHYDPMTLFLVSGYEQYAQEQFPPEEPSPMMGHNGGPPMQPAMPGAAPPPGIGAAGINGGPPPPLPGMQPPADPIAAARAKAAQVFKAAVELLRNDKLRGFRIEIETDSIVEPDQQQTQQSRTELLGAISQFLPQAMEAGQAIPQLRPLLGQLLLFFLRGFKAGRDLEAPFEQFIDDMRKQAQNPTPPPPSPEQIKADAEAKKQQAETQRDAMRFRMEQEAAATEAQREDAKAQREMELKEREAQLREREMQNEYVHKERMLQLKEREAQIGLSAKVQTAQLDMQTKERGAQIEGETMERQAELGAEADERKHTLALETAEAKAKQAKAPKKNG
jgi:hypothetical protein